VLHPWLGFFYLMCIVFDKLNTTLIMILERIACRSKEGKSTCFATLFLKFLNSTGYYEYHQVQNSKILHVDYIACMCFVWLSEERVFLALYIIN
jgi:hypothetical protein